MRQLEMRAPDERVYHNGKTGTAVHTAIIDCFHLCQGTITGNQHNSTGAIEGRYHSPSDTPKHQNIDQTHLGNPGMDPRYLPAATRTHEFFLRVARTVSKSEYDH